MSMAPAVCNVCAGPLSAPVYESEHSLTSLCDIFPETTRVRICNDCGHLQTDEIADAAAFYDDDYLILVNSEEEDQIYEVRDGHTLYRTGHQVATLLEKLDPAPGTRLLDYGCAKSSTVRALLRVRPDLKPSLFDVSDRYVPFWDKFLPAGSWATYDIPAQWESGFDIVTSFFSLEHMVEPGASVQRIAGLLAPGGRFYGIVPNVLTNTADFLVIDHVNHFTRSSLARLLTAAGLEVCEIDDAAHRGAFVFTARKGDAPAAATIATTAQAGDMAQLEGIAAFWRDAAARVQAFEAGIDDSGEVAVYGAGFYGAFIRSCLSAPERVCCVLDQNPFLQGTQSQGVPVLAPDRLPDSVQTLLVGLNPAHARNIIADIPSLAGRALKYYFL